jgi:DNA topoisomerase I
MEKQAVGKTIEHFSARCSSKPTTKSCSCFDNHHRPPYAPPSTAVVFFLFILIFVPKNLVIVESPAKAKTIKKFLGKDFAVEASMGHVRDLESKKLSVDTENRYEPTYVIPDDKKTVVKKLKKALKETGVLWIATDEDREGEAIGWHLLHALNVKKDEMSKIKRIVFHEITEEAIQKAVRNPRTLNIKLIEAQQARRILDRLVGYTLSPFLWAKVYRGLSAGRVQSVAVRIIVDREREILAFKPEEYWTVEAELETEEKVCFTAELKKKDGEKEEFIVRTIEEKKLKKNPSAPFTTSTLQQDASNKLGFSVKQTMVVAQQLYEGINLGKGTGQVGLITYMRTDSVNLSKKAIEDAAHVIEKLYGREYLLSKPRVFKKKSKNAQEAHEAIRPTELIRTPESLKDELDQQQLKLYTLIWNRTMATQMAAADLKRVGVDITAGPYTFRATGQTIEFDGFLRVYRDMIAKEKEQTEEQDNEEKEEGENFLPKLSEGQHVHCHEVIPEQHFTQPPPRYNEASLVKKLEEEGIGRPSTYAPTISTIQQRGYVRKDGRQLIPEQVAFTVTDLLIEHFADIVDLQFTAKVEDSLDEISMGTVEWVPFMDSFFKPFSALMEKKKDEVKKEDVIKETTDEKCPDCGADMTVKLSRYGKFLACTKYPKCKGKKPTPENAEKHAAQEEQRKEMEKELGLENCPDCGSALIVKRGRYGMFIGCSGYPKCKHIQKIQKSSGVQCEHCKKGELVEKRTRKGKMFWGCSEYPTCENASWTDPTKTPQTGKVTVVKEGTKKKRGKGK